MFFTSIQKNIHYCVKQDTVPMLHGPFHYKKFALAALLTLFEN